MQKIISSSTLSMEMEATAASETVSRLPIDLAARERWENEVFNASRRLITMLMNCFGEIDPLNACKNYNTRRNQQSKSIILLVESVLFILF